MAVAAPVPRGEMLRGLAIVYLPSLLVAMAQTMVVPVIPRLVGTFDVSPGLAAQVVTAQILGRVLAGVPAGIFTDRFGGRTALITGAGILTAGSVGAMLAPSFVVLMGAQFIAGVGGSLWLLAREIATIDLVAREQRGRAMSGIFGLTNTGSAIGPVVGGFVITAFGFRAPFLVAALVAFISMLFGFAVRDTGTRAARTKFAFALSRLDLLPAEYRVTYVVLILGTFAAFVRMQTGNSLLPLLMVTQLGYTEAALGVQFAILGAVTLLMIAPAGYVSDHWGRKAPSVSAAVLSTVLSLGYGFATSIPTLSVLSVVAGIATGFGLGAMTTYTYDIVPTEVRGQFQAFRRAAGDAGSLVGPSLGGFVVSIASPSVAMLVFTPLHLISALVLIFLARETLKRRSTNRRPT